MKAINIRQAKTHFSRLVARAEAGEEIVIAKAGRPAARLVPLGAAGRPIAPPKLNIPAEILDNFNTLFEKEIEKMFDGRAFRKRAKSRRK